MHQIAPFSAACWDSTPRACHIRSCAAALRRAPAPQRPSAAQVVLFSPSNCSRLSAPPPPLRLLPSAAGSPAACLPLSCQISERTGDRKAPDPSNRSKLYRPLKSDRNASARARRPPADTRQRRPAPPPRAAAHRTTRRAQLATYMHTVFTQHCAARTQCYTALDDRGAPRRRRQQHSFSPLSPCPGHLSGVCGDWFQKRGSHPRGSRHAP